VSAQYELTRAPLQLRRPLPISTLAAKSKDPSVTTEPEPMAWDGMALSSPAATTATSRPAPRAARREFSVGNATSSHPDAGAEKSARKWPWTKRVRTPRDQSHDSTVPGRLSTTESDRPRSVHKGPRGPCWFRNLKSDHDSKSIGLVAVVRKVVMHLTAWMAVEPLRTELHQSGCSLRVRRVTMVGMAGAGR